VRFTVDLMIGEGKLAAFEGTAGQGRRAMVRRAIFVGSTVSIVGVYCYAMGRARPIVHGIEREKRLVVAPLMMKLTSWQHADFPGIVQWLMSRTGYARSRERSAQ
jgi:hypothetical protein